jgi:hypothetical protein
VPSDGRFRSFLARADHRVRRMHPRARGYGDRRRTRSWRADGRIPRASRFAGVRVEGAADDC